MSKTDEMSKAIMEATGADMANKLGMTKEEDMTNLEEGQFAMMVTASGIATGEIRAVTTETQSARITAYMLADTVLPDYKFSEVILAKHRFSSDGKGSFFKEANIFCTLPEGATLYVQ